MQASNQAIITYFSTQLCKMAANVALHVIWQSPAQITSQIRLNTRQIPATNVFTQHQAIRTQPIR